LLFIRQNQNKSNNLFFFIFNPTALSLSKEKIYELNKKREVQIEKIDEIKHLNLLHDYNLYEYEVKREPLNSHQSKSFLY
jgi:hypothetical protein